MEGGTIRRGGVEVDSTVEGGGGRPIQYFFNLWFFILYKNCYTMESNYSDQQIQQHACSSRPRGARRGHDGEGTHLNYDSLGSAC